MFLSKRPTRDRVLSALGSDSTAQRSVLTATYCFLRSPGSFKEAVSYAVSLGGDTDTVGAMTGAIAGAYCGASAIPTEWYDRLEQGPKGRGHMEGLAHGLWMLRNSRVP